MDRDQLADSADWRFWAVVLDEAHPEVVKKSKAALICTTKREEDVVYEAVAYLVDDGLLHLFSMKSEGPRIDDQTEEVTHTVVRLADVATVTSITHRAGWGRGEETRSMKDRAFQALIRFRLQVADFGTAIKVPPDNPAKVATEAYDQARAFVDALHARLS